MEENIYKVYRYTNLINGKMYIGRTKTSLVARAGKDGKKYYSLRYFGAAIKKYGWENFHGEILEDNLTWEECCIKEKYYIALYDTMNREKGYNLHKGGEGPTKECLEKMRQVHLNYHLSDEHKKHIAEGVGQGINNVNYGRKHTDIARKHIGDAKRGDKHPNWGKHLSKETCNKIKESNSLVCIQYDLDHNFIKEWESAKEAANVLGYNYTAINNCLRGIRHSSFGFIWEYKDKELYNQYEDNRYILNNFGINGFKRKTELLQQRNNQNNQEKSSTTILEIGVE